MVELELPAIRSIAKLKMLNTSLLSVIALVITIFAKILSGVFDFLIFKTLRSDVVILGSVFRNTVNRNNSSYTQKTHKSTSVVMKALQFATIILALSFCTYFTLPSNAVAQNPFVELDGIPDSVREGGEITVGVRVLQGAAGGWSSSFSVDVEITGPSNFVDPKTVRLNIPASTTTPRTFSAPGDKVMIKENDIYGDNGSITVALKNSNAYQDYPGTERKSKNVTITDNDQPPIVTISSSAPTTMNESPGMQSIDVTATGKWQSEFSVGVSLDEGLYDFLTGATNQTSVTFPANTTDASATQMYTLNVNNDTINDPDSGAVTIELQAGQNYRLGNKTTHTITIADSEDTTVLPEIYLDYTLINGDVVKSEATEGELILISVKSNSAVNTAIDVMIEVSQVGDFFIPVPSGTPLTSGFTNGIIGSNTVTIASGKDIAFIGIATLDDEFDESNGSISFSVERGTGTAYARSTDPTQNRTKTIVVNDNEEEPIFSIATKYTKVSDTDFFEVSVTSSKESERTFAVNLSISSPLNGLIASANQTATLNFVARDTIETHRVPIESGVATNTTSGHPVTVTIEPSDSYNVKKSARSVQVNVVSGTNLPTVTIAANSSSISEGSPAGFRITVSPGNPDGKIINLGVSSMGDFVYRTPADTIEVPANMVTADYLVPTVSDGSSGSQNGSITVTLEPGDGYKLPPSNQASAMVTVSNDGMAQKPILFIENKVGVDSASVGSAGANAEFTVFSNVNAGNNFSIQARATNLDGNFLGYS